MAICCALLKHGHSNFKLEILEYCEPSKCLIREKHYWDLFNPEYNLAKDPTAPMSGRKHSEETKQILSDSNKGENNPFFGKIHSDEARKKISDAKKGKTFSDETKEKISVALKGKKNPMYNKPKPEGAGRPSQQVEVVDNNTNDKTTYNSMDEAARALNLPSYKIISNYILRDQKKPYKGRYTFKKVN